jgi:hypothetical protein
MSLVSNANQDGGNSALIFGKTRGTAVGSTTVVQSGDVLGRITFQGSDGTEFVQAADIYAEVDGTPGANDMPGRLVFATTADGAASPTERMRLDSSGRLGLGTSTPQALLDVNTKSSAGNLNVINASTENLTGAGSQAIYIGAYTGTSYGCKIKSIYNYASALATSLAFETTNTSGTLTEAIRIDSSQRVGIGTTAASERLSVNDSANNAAISVRTGGAAFNAVVKFNADDTNYAGIGLENTALVMRCSNSSTPTERARIDSSGRLLVGTSSSRNVGSSGATLLQLESTSYRFLSTVQNSNDAFGSQLYLGKSRGTAVGSSTAVQSGDEIGYLGFAAADGTDVESVCAAISAVIDGTPGSNDVPGRLVFSTTADGASSPTERMRINNAGNVIFSNLAAAYPATDNAVTLGASGQRWSAVWAANGTIQTSDERAKTDINDAQLGSDFIKSLRPVSYKWIEGSKRDTGERDEDNNYIYEFVPGTRTHWGFIAQEVKQAVDAAGVDFGGWVLTDKDDPDSQQALRYDQFIAPLTKALQEALAEIEALKAKVAALEGA